MLKNEALLSLECSEIEKVAWCSSLRFSFLMPIRFGQQTSMPSQTPPLSYKFRGPTSKCHALQICRQGCCHRFHLQRRSRVVEPAESTLWAIRSRRIPETRACAEV